MVFRTTCGVIDWHSASLLSVFSDSGAPPLGSDAQTWLRAHGATESRLLPATWILPLADASRGIVYVGRAEAMGTDTELWLFEARTTPATPTAQTARAADAAKDPATGLATQLPAADELETLVERPHAPLVVCYLYVDRVHDLNTSEAPHAAAHVMPRVADRLSEVFPCSRFSLARVGDEEFAVMSLGPERYEYEGLLQQLKEGLSHLRVSVSAGVAHLPRGEQTTAALMRRAQHAALDARRAGGDHWRVFDAQRAAQELAAEAKRAEIRQGLDRSEFMLLYQPKVDMRRGRVVGVEALARWNHPERGVLPPSEFVPIIQDHELTERLGDWAISEALTQVRRWHEAGLCLPVSVNVSGNHLLRAGFIDRLRSHLALIPGSPRGVLELEILETSAIHDFDEVAPVIEACRELGISVALDDFGTGYSSLTYLRRLPVSTLKLDRSFVQNMLSSEQDHAIVGSVVQLAHALSLTVVAEGVESCAHGERLLALGCDLAQGFGIAVPLPAQSLPSWVAQYEQKPLWQPLAR